MPASPAFSKTSAINALVFFLLSALILFAPLIRGGNRPMPLMALELMSLPLLASVLWNPVFLKHLSRPFLATLGVLVLFPLLQWLPSLPAALWSLLPGRAVYAAAQAEFGQGASAIRAISLVPGATEAAWLAMLPALAVFLAVVGLREDMLRRAVYLFLGMAAFQAVLSLLQFGGGWGGGFRINPDDIGRSIGTYANRNHLAGLLEMALPIVLGLLAARIGRGGGTPPHYSGRGWLRRVGRFLVNLPRPNQTMLFAALSILLLLGLIFTRSRSGVVLGMVGIFLSALFYSRRTGAARSGSLVLLGVIGLALAAMVGLAPVLGRFSMEDTLADARWPIYASSLAALWQFFPFGSGLGTFPDVYPRFQPDSIADFVNHAHNDYIEFVFEGGLPALVVVVMFLAMYAVRWRMLLSHEQWSTLNFMQAGAGVGLLLMALHSLTDFNLHIPANAIYFALIAAVFFHRTESRVSVDKIVWKEPKPAVPAPVPAGVPVPQMKGSNPFAD